MNWNPPMVAAGVPGPLYPEIRGSERTNVTTDTAMATVRSTPWLFLFTKRRTIAPISGVKVNMLSNGSVWLIYSAPFTYRSKLSQCI